MSAQIDVGAFRLESYADGWTVGKLRTRQSGKREGEDYLAEQTYHATLTQALTSLADRHLREGDARSFEDLRRELDALKAELLGLLTVQAPEGSETKRRRRVG